MLKEGKNPFAYYTIEEEQEDDKKKQNIYKGFNKETGEVIIKRVKVENGSKFKELCKKEVEGEIFIPIERLKTVKHVMRPIEYYFYRGEFYLVYKRMECDLDDFIKQFRKLRLGGLD